MQISGIISTRSGTYGRAMTQAATWLTPPSISLAGHTQPRPVFPQERSLILHFQSFVFPLFMVSHQGRPRNSFCERGNGVRGSGLSRSSRFSRPGLIRNSSLDFRPGNSRTIKSTYSEFPCHWYLPVGVAAWCPFASLRYRQSYAWEVAGDRPNWAAKRGTADYYQTKPNHLRRLKKKKVMTNLKPEGYFQLELFGRNWEQPGLTRPESLDWKNWRVD